MGKNPNKVLSDIRREIWDYLLLKETTITVEYLPGVLNQEADFQFEWRMVSGCMDAWTLDAWALVLVLYTCTFECMYS